MMNALSGQTPASVMGGGNGRLGGRGGDGGDGGDGGRGRLRIGGGGDGEGGGGGGFDNGIPLGAWECVKGKWI